MIETIPMWYRDEVLTDWKYRLPLHLRRNRYRGFERLCFQLICLIFYPIKEFVLLGILFPIFIIKLAVWDWWNRPKYEEVPEYEEEELEEYIPELYFCQIFRIDKDTDLHIIKVEYCPDETAFIRIVSDEAYTTPYKRKVKRDKRGERYITFNNQNFYLDDRKTQPKMPE